MSTVLRVSQIWNGEVMADQIFASPTAVTVGPDKRATFLVPQLGLPGNLRLLRPANGSYALALDPRMGGNVTLRGQEQRVEKLVARGEVPLGAGDWGVVGVDGRGDHQFFFQLILPVPAVPRGHSGDDDLLLPAFAFALATVIIAGFLIWWLGDASHHTLFEFPPPPEALAEYIVTRPPVPPPKVEEPRAGLADGDASAPPASAQGEEGKAGGKGKEKRVRVKDPGPAASSSQDAIRRAVQNRGVLQHRAKLHALGRALPTDRLGLAISDLKGENPTGSLRGQGDGEGTGVGAGKGTGTLLRSSGTGAGGGGTAHADVVTQNAIKTGGTRAPKGVPGGKGLGEVGVDFHTGTAEGEFDGLTREQVDQVVKQHKSAIRFCFEKELQRNPNLGGKISMGWRIERNGGVSSVRVKSSTVSSGAVQDCISRAIPNWRFPSSDGTTVVRNYPFIFSGR